MDWGELVKKNLVWGMSFVTFIGFTLLVGKELSYNGVDPTQMIMVSTIVSSTVFFARLLFTSAQLRVQALRVERNH